MFQWISKRKPIVVLAIGLVAGLLVGSGMLIGSLVTLATAKGNNNLVIERPVTATATHGSKKFAMATGRVGDNTEGVFMLDFLTGDLLCNVVYPRTRDIRAKFGANVARDLGGAGTGARGKDPDYVMVTGVTQFNDRTISQCVVYVADANTGNYVIYVMPWDRNAVSNGRNQVAPMRVLARGTARNVRIEN